MVFFRVRRLIGLVCLCVLAGCAAPGHKASTPVQRRSSGFASADAKNIHDFLLKYQNIIMSDDTKAILRMYVRDARMVPYLVYNRRVLTKRELAARLEDIRRLQRRAHVRLRFREPMDIVVSGEQARVHVLADMTWEERGKARHAVLDCSFGLVRIDYVWRIKRSHQEATTGAHSATQADTPDRRDKDTPSQPLVPLGATAPQPLF